MSEAKKMAQCYLVKVNEAIEARERRLNFAIEHFKEWAAEAEG